MSNGFSPDTPGNDARRFRSSAIACREAWHREMGGVYLTESRKVGRQDPGQARRRDNDYLQL